jgi:hypothetical protein
LLGKGRSRVESVGIVRQRTSYALFAFSSLIMALAVLQGKCGCHCLRIE